MGWLAAASFGLNLVGGIMGGNAEADAARDANKAREKAAKDQYERDLKVWELEYLGAMSNYSWDVASVAAQRYQERVKEYDYNQKNAGIIEAAIQNLEINSQVLNQTYVLEEELRAKQVSQELTRDLGSEMIDASSDFAQLRENSLLTTNKAAEANNNTRDRVSQYMASIASRANAADQILAKTDSEGQAIQEQILISESLDTMKRDADYITAIVSDAEARASITSKQGGSSSSKRVAMQAMQEFGRDYGMMQARQKDMRRNLSNFNEQTNGQTSAQLAQIASQIGGEAERIKYTSSANALQQEGLMLQQMGIGSQMGSRQATFNLKTQNTLANFNNLTIPSFGLARAQGEREAKALFQNTINTIKGASTPYRGAIIFDPLVPIAGLKPEYSKPTMQSVPGTGAILGRSFMSGVQGALSQSYTDGSGNTQFR